jgi:hypothetical protein
MRFISCILTNLDSFIVHIIHMFVEYMLYEFIGAIHC